MPAWQGMWDNEFGETYTSPRSSRQVYKQLRMATRGKRGREVRELLLELIGAAAGATAAASEKRIQGTVGLGGVDLGGARPIETRELINRTTVAGDITAIEQDLARSPKPSTYVADASGNGGGAKLGF